MSDHEWHDIAKYNLVMPQKSMIKLYNIKSISHHYTDKIQHIVFKGTKTSDISIVKVKTVPLINS